MRKASYVIYDKEALVFLEIGLQSFFWQCTNMFQETKN